MTVTLALVLEPHHDAMQDADPVAWTSGYVAATLRGAGVRVLSCSVRMPEAAPALAKLERERHPTLAAVVALEPEVQPPEPAGDGWAGWAEDDIPAAAVTDALDVGPGLRQALAAAAETMHELDEAAADPHLDPHPGGLHADLVQQRGDERRATALDELSAAIPFERRSFDPDRVREHQADAQRTPQW